MQESIGRAELDAGIADSDRVFSHIQIKREPGHHTRV